MRGLSDEPRPRVRLVLVQALAKGDRDELAAETATELGIDAVIPWQSERSIVRWKADRAAKAHAKWQSVVTAAAKQARRAWIPEVRAAVDGAGLQAAVAAADLAIILHEDAVRPLRQVLEPGRPPPLRRRRRTGAASREVLLIVGPEGGISPREVTRLCDAGAVTALLGHHVLRSSTAGPAADGACQRHPGPLVAAPRIDCSHRPLASQARPGNPAGVGPTAVLSVKGPFGAVDAVAGGLGRYLTVKPRVSTFRSWRVAVLNLDTRTSYLPGPGSPTG